MGGWVQYVRGLGLGGFMKLTCCLAAMVCSQGPLSLCKPFGIYATEGTRNVTITPTEIHAPNKKESV
jgi:hypothetical protein